MVRSYSSDGRQKNGLKSRYTTRNKRPRKTWNEGIITAASKRNLRQSGKNYTKRTQVMIRQTQLNPHSIEEKIIVDFYTLIVTKLSLSSVAFILFSSILSEKVWLVQRLSALY